MLSHCAPISTHSTNKYLSSGVNNLLCITLPSTGIGLALDANCDNSSSYKRHIRRLFIAALGLTYLPPMLVSLHLCGAKRLLYDLLNAAMPSTDTRSVLQLILGVCVAPWQDAHLASMIGCISLLKSTVLSLSI